MPGTVWLTNRATGQDEPLAPEQVTEALASGKYLDPSAVAVHAAGQDTYVAPGVARTDQAYTPAIDPAIAARAAGHQLRQDENAGVGATLKAAAGGAVSGLSFGLASPFEDAQEFNPIASGVGQVAGALAPALVGDEGSLLSLGRLGRGAAVADDALTAERATSALSSRALFAGKGAAAEAGTLEHGLAGASAAIDEARASGAVAPELAAMDAKGLRGAHAAELDVIEASRVPQRAALADDLAAFRAQARDDKLFLVTKGIKEDGIGALGKRTLKADRQLDNLLDNPIRMAAKPEQALAALQLQDAALEGILAKSDKLRAAFAADTTGARAATLDKIPAALEQNRALQRRIAELAAEPASERLAAIRDAQAALSVPKPALPPTPPPSIAEQALSGTAFGAITGAVHAIPVLGQIPGLAHFIGAKGAKLATDLVFGKLGQTTAELAARGSQAAEAFLGRAATTPTAAVLATKTLGKLAFAPSSISASEDAPAPAAAPAKKLELASLYKQRADEVRSQTMYDATGKVVMRPEQRQVMAQQLDAIRAFSPMLADRMESVAVRRIEFLSSLLPRRPDFAGVTTGPDHWRPSDFEMRTWARYAAAVEDPHGVLERLAHGAVTPEDVHAMNAVYPELMADYTNRVVTALPELRKTLPYRRQIALSLFTGVPVDPALDPRVLSLLQSQFTEEPGSAGGTQAPAAMPQYGSIKKSTDTPTPAQRRAQGAA
jgi:hypothetical protein